MRFILCVYSLLVYSTFLFAQNSKGHSLVSYKNDSTEISNTLKKISKLYYDARHDSVFLYLNKISAFAKEKKYIGLHPEIYFWYGQYYRGHTQYNWNKALNMFNKALFWALLRKDNDLSEEINYKKLTVYSDIFLGTSTSTKYQQQLVKQLYENIRFSEVSKSNKHLYKSLYLFKDIYYTYKQDSTYYSQFGKYLKTAPIPRESVNHPIIYFGYYIHYKDFANAKKCFESLSLFHQKKEISDMVYAYYLNDMMRESLNYPPLSNQIATKLKDKLALLPGPTDSLTYYNNFATLNIKNKQFDGAYFYSQQAAHLIKRNPALAITHRLDFLLNQLPILEYQNKKSEMIEVYKKMTPIKDSLNYLFSGFNLLLLQEQVQSNLKIKQYQQEIQLKKYESQKFEKQKQRELFSLLLIIFSLCVVLGTIIYQVIKIRRQANSLLKLTATQNTLFGVIGHDLRSPVLATYTNLKKIINNPKLNIEELRDNINPKLTRLNTLLLTLDNLLYWANTQQQSFKKKTVQCNLFEMVEESIELLETNIELNELTVVNNVNPDYECFIDENHFKIILRNLLQNAIKFTPPQTTITFSSNIHPSFVTLSILDSGPGFQNTVDSQEKGSGLGLTLVQSLLKMNHGAFSQQDTPQGALVTLTLPTANK